MSQNRLAPLFRNGAPLPNEELLTARDSSTRRDTLAIPGGVSDEVVNIVRKYPGQALAVGVLVGAAVAILLRKFR